MTHHYNDCDATIAGRIFIDTNMDNTEWADSGYEPGVGGQTVQLLSEAGMVLAETTTNSEGHYSFENIDPGCYYVQFPATVDGMSPVVPDQGSPYEDSDILDTGRTVSLVEVTKDFDQLNIDAGYNPASAEPQPDGIVEGTDDADVIDDSYAGDPNGDFVNNDDALLPGETGDDDIIYAYGGDDTVIAGDDSDEVYAGAGDDYVDGGAGDDMIRGDSDTREDSSPDSAGNDTLIGGAGNDTIYGEGGDDTIDGGEGNDTLYGDNGATGEGFDTGDLIQNGSFEDTSGMSTTGYGYVSTGSIVGWSTLDPNSEIDVHNDDRGSVEPTDGDNWLDLEQSPGNISVYQDVENVVEGEDYTLTFDAADSVINADNTFDVYWGGELLASIDPAEGTMETYTFTVTGGAGDGSDRLMFVGNGNGDDNIGVSIDNVALVGAIDGTSSCATDDGDDTISGGAGEDLIYGEGGDDTLDGGEGDDTIYGDYGSESGSQTTGELIVNGSFEDTTGMETTGYGYVATGAIVGWQTETPTDQIDVHNNDRGSVEPTDGENWLDLEQTPGNITVYQDVEGVVAGAEYTLTFDAADAVYLGDNTFDVSWGGEVLATIDPAEGTMESFTFTVIGGAGDGSDRLSFTGNGTGDNMGVSIDSVSLVGPIAGDDCEGEEGNDTITGGAGSDTMYGEGGDDTFIVASGADGDGDVIVGGNGPDDTTDVDTLDLTGAGKVTIDASEDTTDADAFTGTVTFSDGSVLAFSQIEEFITDPQNDGPDAVDDQVDVDEDSSVSIPVKSNDSDPDGDPLTVTSFNQPTNGTVTENPDGTLQYTPNADFYGTDSFEYTISDGNGGTDTATVFVEVNNVAEDPTARPDELTTDEDTPLVINVETDLLSNDSDPDGDVLTLILGTEPSHGSIVENGDGTVTYVPDADYNGTDTFEYTVSDGNGGTDTTTVTITVNPVNDDPIAEEDDAETEAGDPVTIDVLDNDSDVDGDELSVLSFEQPTNGTVTENPDGSLEYTPNDDFTGTDTFSYTVTDGNGGTDTATVSVNVKEPEENTVVAEDDSYTIDEDGSLVVDVTVNDSDPQGDDFSVTSVGTPTNGTAEILPDGTVKYVPDENYNGTDSFTYTITDEEGATSTATVTVNITPVPDAPDAEDDIVFTDEGDAISFDPTANDSDPEGDPLTITSFDLPTNGSVTENPDGTLEYTPNADFTGTDTFEYTISDGNGGTDTATVTVVVQPEGENFDPNARPDREETDEDTPVTIDVLDNDSDPNGDPLVVTSFEQPENGTVTENPDGTLEYTPDGDWNGTDTFTYTVSDGKGGTDTSTVTVVVNPVNDDPVAEEDDAETEAGDPVTIDVLDNDSDVDGDELSVLSFEQPTNGTVTENPDGSLEYTPNDDFTGTDTFSYTVTDGNGGTDTATVSVNVKEPEENTVVAEDDSYTIDEDGSLVVDVTVNDSDPQGDDFSVTAVGTPSNGTAEILPDGTVKYVPDENYNGTDSFTYTITDEEGATSTATVTVNITPVPDAPDAEDDIVFTDEGDAISFDPTANDSDPEGDPLTITSFDLPTNGSVTENPDGTLEYTPNADFTGTDTFDYTISDGNGGTDTATVTVVVQPEGENFDPNARPDREETDEDTPVTIDVLDNDSDPNGDPLVVTSFEQPENGTVTENPDGTLEYTPDGDWNGTDTFSYTVSDGKGGTDTSTVTVVVNPVNDDPVAEEDDAETEAGDPVTIDVLDNDSDVDGDTLTVLEFTQPTNGTVTENPDGTLEYTPNDDFTGTDTFSYTVTDGNGGTDTATVTVDVTPEGTNTVDAEDDSYEIPEDGSLIVDVTVNDSDPEGHSFEVTAVGTPTNGTAEILPDGTVKYVPDADFNGTDTFEYTITDELGATDIATVTVTVTPEPDAPDAEDDIVFTDEDEAIDFDPTANDSDPDGEPLTITSFDQPTNGTVTENPDGTLKYTPDADYTGTDTFEYTISDGTGGTDTATVTLVVQPEDAPNEEPIARDDSGSTEEDISVSIDVLGNDVDPDGDTLLVADFDQPANGTVTENPDGTLEYTPDAGYLGTDTFEYTVSDGKGGTDIATVTVTVTPEGVNEVDAVDDAYEIPEDSALIVDVTVNDSDPEGDDFEVTSVGTPTNGTAELLPDGTVKYVPNPDFNGTDSFTYTVTDEFGATDVATVNITVSPEPDAPDAEDDIVFTNEDEDVTFLPTENDEDPDGDPLTILSFDQPTNGTVTENSDGTLTYTPDPDYTGTDTFDYTITDGTGGTDTATITVAVRPEGEENLDPVARPDTEETEEGDPVTIDVLGNDTDPDQDPLEVLSFEQPTNGTVTENPDGTLEYTPNSDFTGTDTFEYTVTDGNGGTDTSTVTVTVTPESQNVDPEATDDREETDEDTPVTIDVLANDTDLDGDELEVLSFEQPDNGTVTENADGTLEYTPDANWNGTDTFDYTVTDGNGGTATATVTVVVEPVNDAPEAKDDGETTEEDSPVTVDLLDNDGDVDGDVVEVLSFEQPANGTVTENPDGTLEYTPDAGFTGTDTFEYTVTDGNGATDVATVTVTVTPEGVNTVDAVDDAYEIPEDSALIVDLTTNDSDPEGDDFEVTSVGTPTNGTAELLPNGTVKYVPNPDFNGTDTFEYTVTDEFGATDVATVTLTVTPEPDAPDAEDDIVFTDEDEAVTFDPTENDEDPDGDPLTVLSFDQPENGTVTQNPDGTLEYTPDADYTGTDTFDYTISDGTGGTDTATITVVVEPEDGENEDPTATPDTEETDEDTPVDIDVLGNDTDPDQDPLEVLSFEQPTNGTVTENPDGTLKYTPDTDFTGTDTFEYTVTDGNGGTDTTTVTVTVGEPNDVDALDDTEATDLDTAVDIDVLANDTDDQGDDFEVTSFEQPSNGTVTENVDGTLKYTPDTGFTGIDTFEYTITDDKGATDTATVTIRVGDVDELPPVASDDSDKTLVETPVVIDVLANDTDPDGNDDALEVIDATSTFGTVAINPDGTITFTPNVGVTGLATVDYTIEDEDGLTDTATVEVFVTDGIVYGTDGDDVIDTEYDGDPTGDYVDSEDNLFDDKEPDDDIIIAGDGDDEIDAGDGDDEIYGGNGSDDVDAGDGDDYIDTRGETEASDHGFLPDEEVEDWPFDPLSPYDLVPVDDDPDDDKDIVYGGDGDDTIYTGDDADDIDGGKGDDFIDGGLDDDEIDGNDGDDTIIGGHGADDIDGGKGDDTIWGGLGEDEDFLNLEDDAYPVDDYDDEDDNDPIDAVPTFLDPRPDNGTDTIHGGEGNDTIYGQDDDDVLYGDEGDDFIDGGIDDDEIYGGIGDDEILGGKGQDYIDGGEGEDVMDGGDDQDTFVNVNDGDTVDGGEGGDDWDTLNLIGSAPDGGWLQVTLDDDNEENGTVDFYDDKGQKTGSMDFVNIEEIIICFTPGTLIATPRGEVPVETLREGDRVITRDNGMQEIRWIGQKHLTWKDMMKSPHLKPVLIKAGSLGPNLPERDMMVSPNHRMLVANDHTSLMFDEREVLASAKHLIDNKGVMSVDVKETTYIHMLFDHHEVVLSDGTWSETFQPGDYSLSGIGDAQRQEVFELFPELETGEGIKDFTAARRILKKHEAQMLTRGLLKK